MIVGAFLTDAGGVNRGESYVVFGASNLAGDTIPLNQLGSGGFTLRGYEDNGWAGAVSGAGDVNDDGFADVIIGATNITAGGTARGEAYVVFGGSNLGGATRVLNDLGSGGFTLRGFADRGSAGSGSEAGDVNGDGIDDFLVGAPGIDDVYVIFGSTSLAGLTMNLDSLGAGGFTLRGTGNTAVGDYFNDAGDVNGDGFADIVIGAFLADSGATNAGENYLVYGGNDLGGDMIALTSLGARGFTLRGFEAEALAGFTSTAGDVNSDGLADLIVGAPATDAGGIDRGEAYLILSSRAITVKEGSQAATSGAFADVGADAVSLTASIGAISQAGVQGGSWSWSFTPTDGPGQPQTVTITATDSDGATSTVAFDLMVENVAPAIELSGNAQVNKLAPYSLHLGDLVDPGNDVVTAYQIRWGDGSASALLSGSPAGQNVQHTYATGGVPRTITVDLYDEDGTFFAAGTKTIFVRNAAPNLKVTQKALPARAALGGLVAFQITLRNAGNSLATGVYAPFQLPSRMTRVIPGSSAGWRLVGVRLFRIDVGTLQPGQTLKVVFKARVPKTVVSGGNLITTARVGNDGFNGPDAALADNVFRLATLVG